MQDWVQGVDVAIVGLSAWRQTGGVDCGSRKLRPASKSTRYGEAGSHIAITLADAAGGTDVLAVHAGLPPGVTHVFGGRSGNRSAISERAAQGTCTHSNCGWSGKACNTKLLRILPFNWVFSPTT